MARDEEKMLSFTSNQGKALGTARCRFPPPGRANPKKTDVGSAGVGRRGISTVLCRPWDENWVRDFEERQRPEKPKTRIKPQKDAVGPGAPRSCATCSRAPSNVVTELGFKSQAPMWWDPSQDARCDPWADSQQKEGSGRAGTSARVALSIPAPGSSPARIRQT